MAKGTVFYRWVRSKEMAFATTARSSRWFANQWQWNILAAAGNREKLTFFTKPIIQSPCKIVWIHERGTGTTQWKKAAYRRISCS